MGGQSSLRKTQTSQNDVQPGWVIQYYVSLGMCAGEMFMCINHASVVVWFPACNCFVKDTDRIRVGVVLTVIHLTLTLTGYC